jgi:hypothetical protein
MVGNVGAAQTEALSADTRSNEACIVVAAGVSSVQAVDCRSMEGYHESGRKSKKPEEQLRTRRSVGNKKQETKRKDEADPSGG